MTISTPNIYPKKERDARDLITGNVYSVFARTNDRYRGVFNRANGWQILADAGSDYGYCSWGAGNWGELEFGQVKPAAQYGSTLMYDKGYAKYFGKMILTIDHIEEMDIDVDVKARYIAEAKCGLGFPGFLFYD